MLGFAFHDRICLFFVGRALHGVHRLLQFEYYGSSCWSATFTGNSVKGSQYGDSMLRFASDGAVITWSLPTIHIRGEPRHTATAAAPGVLAAAQQHALQVDTSASSMCFLFIQWVLAD
jgi:hypothetical protein